MNGRPNFGMGGRSGRHDLFHGAARSLIGAAGERTLESCRRYPEGAQLVQLQYEVAGSSVRPSVPSDCPFVRPTVRSFVRSSVRPSVRPFVSLSCRPTVRPTVRSSDRSSVRPSVRSTVRPTVCPSVHPTVRCYRKISIKRSWRLSR